MTVKFPEWGKADIISVGIVDELGEPQNWMFDCKGTVPALNIQEDGIRHAGYTIDELRAISAEAAR